METWRDGVIFASTFCLCALAGFAALLRSGGTLTVSAILSSCLNSGLLGTAICLLWYETYKENLYALIGVSMVLGLCGMTGVDLVIKYFKQGGLHLHMDKDGKINFGESKDKDPEEK